MSWRWPSRLVQSTTYTYGASRRPRSIRHTSMPESAGISQSSSASRGASGWSSRDSAFMPSETVVTSYPQLAILRRRLSRDSRSSSAIRIFTLPSGVTARRWRSEPAPSDRAG
jgi:hypothetical protein